MAQYKRARVVVEHESSPWIQEDFGNDIHNPEDSEDFGEDFGSAIRLARCECQECHGFTEVSEEAHTMPFKDYHRIDSKQVDNLTSHQYMLMTSHMFAFILKDRKYGMYNSSSLCQKLIEHRPP